MAKKPWDESIDLGAKEAHEITKDLAKKNKRRALLIWGSVLAIAAGALSYIVLGTKVF